MAGRSWASASAAARSDSAKIGKYMKPVVFCNKTLASLRDALACGSSCAAGMIGWKSLTSQLWLNLCLSSRYRRYCVDRNSLAEHGVNAIPFLTIEV